MQTKARKAALIFLGAALLPLLLAFSGFFIYDPLQVYHRPWGRQTSLHSNLRLQAAGVIRHYPFDSVIFGTSMTENTSADEASGLLGSHFVNISLTASDFVERSIVLDYLLRWRKIEQVVFSLDSVYMNRRRGYPLFPISTFDFLYDRNPFNDIRVYLNSHFARCLGRWSGEESCVGRNVGLDHPNAWFREPEHAERFGGMENWCKARDYYQIKDAYEALRKANGKIASGTVNTPSEAELREAQAQAIRYIDENVVLHVRSHPETRFHLLFPPYSRALFAIWYQSIPLDASVHMAVLRHLANLASQLPNMDVYGFEGDDFPDDLANYKDLAHYRESFDSLILKTIASRRNRLSAGNVEDYIRVASGKARAFDLPALQRRLEQCNGPH